MKKLLIFLMVAVPLVIIIIVNLTVNAVVGYVSISVDNVVLDKTSIVANVDEKLVLNAKIYPEGATNKELIWKSDNENVAVVDINGNVTLVGFGEAYITVTSVDGAKSAKCYFYVTDTKVHQVVLYAPKSDIRIGETLQLNATILPSEAENKKIRYTSSDENIARVDANGLVTGVNIGHVSIIATSEDGGHSSYTTLAVVNPVSAIVVDKEEIVTSQSYQTLKYKVLPENASNKAVRFEVDNTIATVSDLGVVSFNEPGEVNVTLTTVDGGYTANCKVICTAGYARSLNIENNNVSARVGDTPIYVNYTTEPSNIYATEIEFLSDNEDIAYVDESGYLQFISGGSTMITARIKSSEDTYIEKTIGVYVESPAEAIVISSALTSATNVYKLTPSSYPITSTNEDYYYYSLDTSKATVDSEGNITFLTQEPCTVSFEIYANEDKGGIRKTVSVYYTGGYATDFTLTNTDITVKYGETKYIETVLYPSDSIENDFSYRVISETRNAGTGHVVSIRNDGSITTLGGGTATVEVSLRLASGETLTKTCTINVIRPVEEVRLIVDLEQENGKYMTALQTVSFNYEVLPEDATDKTVVWSLSDDTLPAPVGNTFIFNYPSDVYLIASANDGEYVKKFLISYVGSSPVSATVTEIPNVVHYGDTLDIEVLSVFPYNAIYRNISLYVSNQNTHSLDNKVLDIQGNRITAVGGGTARLTVYVSSTVQLSYDITVTRDPESITVSPSNITTTKSVLELVANIMPFDTTNKNVIYEVDNEEIATINNGILEFEQNGIVEITARCEADENIKYVFTIEKTNKATDIVESAESTFNLSIGDSIKVDMSTYADQYDYLEYTIVAQIPDSEGEVISLLPDGTITGLNFGIATVNCVLYDEYGSPVKSFDYTINVVQLVERITLNNDLSMLDGVYVTAHNEVALDFKVYPDNAHNKMVNFAIQNTYSSQGIASNSVAYAVDNIVYFNTAGTVVIRAESEDGNASALIRIRYTGGNALQAEINLPNSITLDVGESRTVEVTEWIPNDTINDAINIFENATSGKKLLKIEGSTFTAIAGGKTSLTIDLSSGITKEVSITINKKITSISLDKTEVLISSGSYTVNPIITPADATNRTLFYYVDDSSIATFDTETKTLNFLRAGTVTLKIMSTDGGNAENQVRVTSTLGYIHNIDLNVTEKTLSKNSVFSIISRHYPTDAENNTVRFKIISETANDGSDNHIVSLNRQTGDIRALYGGSATIRAYAYNSYGEEVYKDCIITVISNVTDIRVSFIKTQEYQNSIITADYLVGFDYTIYPVDASNKNVRYTVSNEEVATVVGNNIVFLKEGKVTITFTAEDNKNGNKSVSQSFWYTAGKIVELKLKNSSKIINLMAGESFEIELDEVIPSDVIDKNITIKNKNEIRNVITHQVIDFRDNKVIAINGGSATFAAYAGVGEKFIGNYTVNVTRECNYIETTEDEYYTAISTFNVEAVAMPVDCSNKALRYDIVSGGNIASINTSTGAVVFNSLGTISVKISSISNPEVSKTITVEYTKKIRNLYFRESRNSIFVDEAGVVLSVYTSPLDVDEYSVRYSVLEANGQELITLVDEFNDGTCTVIGKKAGKVTIRATLVEDSTIYVDKEIFINETIRDIRLNIKLEDNAPGIAGYRVFGTRFADLSNGELATKNTYKLDCTVTTASGEANHVDLKWESSNESVATVDSNGVVSFLAPGTVTIKVSPVVQAIENEAYQKYDKFTFNVVDGINVYNEIEFSKVVATETFVVLQSDIISTEQTRLTNTTVKVGMNGNGHLLDFSCSEGYSRITIENNNVLIDNVVLRGMAFGETAALSTLSGTCRVVYVYDGVENFIIRNSIIENGKSCFEIYSADARIEGCIVRNAFTGNVLVSHADEHPKASHVVIKDCVLAKALLSSIVMNFDGSSNARQHESQVLLEGKVYIYNWIRLEDINGSTVTRVLSDSFNGATLDGVIQSVKNVAESNLADHAYKIGSDTYYLLGGVRFSVLNYESNGIWTNRLTQTDDYKPEYLNKDFSVTMAGAITCNLTFLTSLGNRNQSAAPTITPTSTYDSSIYAKIRQPYNY